jgi:hypothetical protein
MFADSLPKRPDTLTSKGYKREEGDFDQWGASTKKVRFRKRIDPPLRSLVFDIVIEYELFVSDDPDASWEDNCNYSFEEIRLVVWRRENVDAEDDDLDADRKPRLQKVGTHELRPETLRTLEQFEAVLGYSPPADPKKEGETVE